MAGTCIMYSSGTLSAPPPDLRPKIQALRSQFGDQNPGTCAGCSLDLVNVPYART